jgi:hypothetical protein
LRAAHCALRIFDGCLLLKGLLQDFQHGQVAISARRAFAFDYIRQAGDPELVLAEYTRTCRLRRLSESGEACTNDGTMIVDTAK